MTEYVEIKDGNDELIKVAADKTGTAPNEIIYQRAKMTFGVDGTITDVSTSTPLPVTDTGHATNAALITATNALLTLTNGYVDGLEGLLGVLHVDLQAVDGHVDGLETAVASTNTLLTSGNTVRSNILTAIGGVTASPSFGQKKVAVTGTAVALATSTALTNGAWVQANPNNVAAIVLGLSSVANTTDGTGNGKVLQPGQSWFVAATNLSSIYINGTAGDWVDWTAN